MNEELFPAEAVTMESPRLAWMKKYGVKTHHAAHLSEDEQPWCAWFSTDEGSNGVPDNPDECGYGSTELEAVGALACESGTKLWNEETP